MTQESPEQIIAAAVLQDLCGRSGFDGWWDSIDDETRVDLEVELREVIKAALSASVVPAQGAEGCNAGGHWAPIEAGGTCACGALRIRTEDERSPTR